MNIENFIKYYFPNHQGEVFEEHRLLLEGATAGRQITGWGRGSSYDDGLRYDLSLSWTARALMEGKSVLAVGTFKVTLVEDLKRRFNIDVSAEPQKMGLLLKLK